jgi:hypothetical protein
MTMRLLAGQRTHLAFFLPFAFAPILHLPVEDDDDAE